MGDLTFAARMLRKNPGFSAVAILTLALGVGANTAIFSVIKAVLLNPLPYRDPNRLVTIATGARESVRPVTVDYTTTYDLRARTRSFESMSLYRTWRSALIGDGAPELVNGMRVSHDYFDTLGVSMQLGRAFLPEEDRLDRWNKVVILSHSLWMRRFGGDPKIIGRIVRLNETSCTVVGVLPASFEPIALSQSDQAREIFAPLGYELTFRDACRGCQHLRLLARMKPGVSSAAAEAELNAALGSIVRDNPKSYDPAIHAIATPLRDQVTGRVSVALWVLAGAVGFVLLMACANIANLLLARATGREKEVALRTALGASRARIVRQMFVESLTLAAAGGICGTLLAIFGTSAVVAAAPREIPRIGEVKIDTAVLLFALASSLVAAVLFGLAPALRTSRADVAGALKELGKATSSRGRQSLRNALVIAEFALAFVLIAGAGLLGRSFLNLMNVDPGFDPRNVLTLNTYVYSERYTKPEQELNYYEQVFDRLRATPGIDSMAMVSTLPLTSFDHTALHIQDRPLANPREAPSVDRYSITPDYFRVMRISLKRGRAFTDQDRAGAPLAAIVSESTARTQFAGEDPIGKHIQLGGRDESKPWATIVGVVGDVRQYGLDRAPIMAAYIPQAQNLNFSYMFVARTTIDPRQLEHAVRDGFLSVDKTQPVYDIAPMDSYLRESLGERSFTLALLGLFAALALALAAIGIYGVISYTVSLRTREIGIRMALGARWTEVLGMILKQGLAMAAVGLVAGFLASLALTRFLATLLYEVRPSDVATSAAVAALLAVVALAASYFPARRAARVDPVIALRYE
ncbi:MAG: ABC transporter permease [Acidobacteriia bacterium]|nr:ABC transporter permease [Terriglobia bacterium]